MPTILLARHGGLRQYSGMTPIDAPKDVWPLELECTCTQPEMREAAAVDLYEHLGRGSKWRAWLVAYGVTTLVLGSLLNSYLGAFPPRQRLLLIAGISAGVVALLPLLGRFLRHPLVSTRLVASGRGLLIETNDSCITLPWTSFDRILETNGLLVLMRQKNQPALVIPKRAFPNEEAVQALRSMIAKRNGTPAPRCEVWKTFGSPPIMLPKGSFASPGDVEIVRNLLRAHLKRSRWVMG